MAVVGSSKYNNFHYRVFVTSGTARYINHQHNDRGIDEIMFLRKEEVKGLKQQIEELNRQNTRLIELLGEKAGNAIG